MLQPTSGNPSSAPAPPVADPGGLAPQHRWTRVARLLVALAATLSGLGMLGWLLNIPALYSLASPEAAIRFNTTVLLLLIALGTWHQTLSRRLLVPDVLLAISVLLISGLSFAQYVLNTDFGIDQLLIADPTSASDVPPGRMSVLTGFCGILLGAGLGLLASRAWVAGQCLALVVLVLSYGSMLAHLFGISRYYTFGQFSSIAVQTSLSLMLLALALFIASPQRGLMPALTNPLPGGRVARAASLYILLTPPLLAVLSSALVNRAGFAPVVAVSLLVLLFVVATLLLLYRVSNQLNDSHRQMLVQFTARQQADRDRQTQAELLQTLIDNTQVGIGLMTALRDAAGTIVDFRWDLINGPGATMTGLPLSRMLGGRMTDVMPGTVESGTLDRFAQVVETNGRMHYETRYTVDGINGWFDTTVIRLGDGVLFSALDVTARKESELAVARQSALLRTIIDTSPAGIILYQPLRRDDDPAGTITDFVVTMANVSGAQLVGQQLPAAFLGRRMRELLPSDDGRQFFEQVVAVVETGRASQWLLPYFADGIDGWFNMTVVRQDGQALVTFLDVTDLKQLQEQLETRNRDLQRSNEYLQQFAYVASHDLQEPLRKIQQFGDILATRYAPTLDEAGVDILHRMRNSAGRMSGLIKELLAYSRLSTRTEPFGAVSLSAVLTDVLDDLSVVIQETHASITADPLPAVVGDAQQLRQLLQNLVANALKFHRPDQPPRVRIGSRLPDPAELPAELVRRTGTTPPFCEISVADNGIGFDEKYLDRLFQMFQRLHGRNEKTGSGLGLAICKKVADNHNGLLTARSRPGAGATFFVYLPLAA
jgi:signal transduction histidine kinase